MITGFNTDIEYGGVTYHVQTEDKGLSKPLILSLVYDRGTILASKRASYEDMLGGDFSEKALSERLHKQHRIICAAIKAGRIEELKHMTARDSANAKLAVAKAEAEAVDVLPMTVPAFESFDLPFVSPLGGYSDERSEDFESETPLVLPLVDLPGNQGSFFEAKTSILPPLSTFLDDNSDAFESGTPIPKPFFKDVFEVPAAALDKSMTDGISIVEDEIILPAEAVAIINESAFTERPVNNKLSIEILGDAKFKGGDRSTVGFMVSRGSSRKVVTGAQIMVKILGSSFRTVIFHASTDNNGVATVNLQLPNFSSGRAAFLVRAMSDGEEIELRRSIAHG
ncbi:MAG: hypothetical protein ABIU09_08975 [Pyrinomonadaceae bacterium]